MFPIIPLLALLAIGGGGATLIWYDRLTKEKQDEADAIAGNYANQLFGKAVGELTHEQRGEVARLTSRHFTN